MEILPQLIFIYLPFLFVVGFSYGFKRVGKTQGYITIRLQKIGVAIPIKVSKRLVYRLLLSILIIGQFMFFALRDYSSFFPSDVTYDIYYDIEKLEDYINEVNSHTSDYHIDTSWKNKRLGYYIKLDSIISTSDTTYKKFFANNTLDRYLKTNGVGNHKMSYIKFWQNYKIEEVSGQVWYELQLPNSQKKIFRSDYYLSLGQNNYVSPKTKDFLFGSMITKSNLKHSMVQNNIEIYNMEIVGITKVRFFPYNRLEFSIFCFESNERTLIPYAYAFYK